MMDSLRGLWKLMQQRCVNRRILGIRIGSAVPAHDARIVNENRRWNRCAGLSTFKGHCHSGLIATQ